MRRIALLTVLACVAGAASLPAQDAHYWAETYGTNATLLGGVVVGRVPDISAAYYNPGRLAFATQPAFALTTRVYELQSTQLDANGTRYDNGKGLGSTTVRPSPSFAAGVLPVGDRKRDVLAYSFLSRQSDDQRIEGNAAGTGTPPVAAEVYLHGQASESWYGVSWSRRLNPRTGFGATLFGAYRSQFQRYEINRQQDAPPEAADVMKQISYYDFRFVLKAGFSSEIGGWAYGATVTTPGLHIMGSGKLFYSDLTTSGTPQYAFSSQEDLGVNYKSPWSFAAGVTRTWGKVSLYLSGEWFAAIDQYALVDADSIRPTDARPAFSQDLTFERKSVVNWGVGVEVRQSPKRAFYASFRSDYSARPRLTNVNTTYDRWGRWHLGGGYSFRLGHWDLVAGLTYGTGSDKYTAQDAGNTPGGIPIPAGATAKLTDRSLRFLFGFNVSL